MPTISPDDTCPCDSGRRAADCCVFGGRAEPRETDTRPKAPRTGFAHSECYARCLNDCSEDLTAEHYISAALLREFAGPIVHVQGFPWQKTERQAVGVSSLKAKILCRRHNQALSRLDAHAERLLRFIRAFGQDIRSSAGGTSVKLFPGIDIERWLLKVMVGFAVAGFARSPAGDPLALSDIDEWARILFGIHTFARTYGLYISGAVGKRFDFDPHHCWLAPLTTNGRLSGCIWAMTGIELALAMRLVDPLLATGALDVRSVHRPQELLFGDPSSTTMRSICLAWNGRNCDGQITLLSEL